MYFTFHYSFIKGQCPLKWCVYDMTFINNYEKKCKYFKIEIEEKQRVKELHVL